MPDRPRLNVYAAGENSTWTSCPRAARAWARYWTWTASPPRWYGGEKGGDKRERGGPLWQVGAPPPPPAKNRRGAGRGRAGGREVGPRPRAHAARLGAPPAER